MIFGPPGADRARLRPRPIRPRGRSASAAGRSSGLRYAGCFRRPRFRRRVEPLEIELGRKALAEKISESRRPSEGSSRRRHSTAALKRSVWPGHAVGRRLLDHREHRESALERRCDRLLDDEALARFDGKGDELAAAGAETVTSTTASMSRRSSSVSASASNSQPSLRGECLAPGAVATADGDQLEAVHVAGRVGGVAAAVLAGADDAETEFCDVRAGRPCVES